MRIKIQLSKSNKSYPIDNQHLLIGFVHNCFGDNDYHDGHSEFSISDLRGGKLNPDKKTVSFSLGAHFYISSLNEKLIEDFIKGLMFNNNLSIGDMKFQNIQPIDEKFFNGINHFKTLSPVLIKINDKFYNINDDNYLEVLTTNTKKKLQKINPKLNLDDFSLTIPNHKNHKTRLIKIKSKSGGDYVVKNKASQYQVSIKCNKEVANILYHYGLGKSTASGFGCIYKTENYTLYRD